MKLYFLTNYKNTSTTYPSWIWCHNLLNVHQCSIGICHLKLASSLKIEAAISSEILYTRLHGHTSVRTQMSHTYNFRFTFTHIVVILWWLLVALFQKVYQLLAALWHQHKHCLHLAGCESRTQCGSHVLPALTCNIWTSGCQTLLVWDCLHGNRKCDAPQIASQWDLAISKSVSNNC
jgi:hypothetical protein